MLESFNYETNELRETNQDLKTYIESCHKESERCAAYLEQNTLHSEIASDIAINSDSITPQKKKNDREEYRQEDHQMPFNENDANKSKNVSRKVNTSKKIETNARNKIEKI